jgi:hypothetical protein
MVHNSRQFLTCSSMGIWMFLFIESLRIRLFDLSQSRITRLIHAEVCNRWNRRLAIRRVASWASVEFIGTCSFWNYHAVLNSYRGFIVTSQQEQFLSQIGIIRMVHRLAFMGSSLVKRFSMWLLFLRAMEVSMAAHRDCMHIEHQLFMCRLFAYAILRSLRTKYESHFLLL